LRAHPLVVDGVIRDGVIGRRLAYATLEWRRWSRPLRGLARVAPAVFVDGARAWDVGTIGDPRAHADVGGGVRISLPGAGVVRIDIARGLRDGRTAMSVGLQR
jgi:outer membrane translocation and assembly module TamA